MKLKKLFILTLLAPMLVQASEVDQFSRRFEPLKDSSVVINEQANLFLQDALTLANRKKGCNEKRLYKYMRKYFRNHVQGQLTPFVIHSDKVEKRVIPLKSSIYKHLTAWISPVIGGLGLIKDTSGVIVRMGNTQIGSDKFEHFFGRGYAYFTRYYKRGFTMDELMKYGDGLERHMLGAYTTAVYSYGDLMANFNGMRFWNNVLQQNDDVFGAEHNLGPYVVCENSRWVQKKKIDFLDYIDAGWDEGNNCSNYKNQRAVDLVTTEVERLTDDKGDIFQCPMQPERMMKLRDKYGVVADKLLNFQSVAVFE